MKMGDICDADHSKRFQHFLKQIAGDDPELRAEIASAAYKTATTEMLNEIHCMLRELTKK